MMTDLLRLLGCLKPYWRRLALAGACLLLGTPAQLFHPLGWLFIVDHVILADPPGWAGRLGASRVVLLLGTLALMLLVHLLGVGLSAWRAYLLGCVGQQFVFDLRTMLYRRLQRHALAFFHRRRSGDLIARTIGDIDALEEVALRGTDEIVSNAVQLVVVAGVVIWLNPTIGLLTLTPMLGVCVIVRLFNARVRGLYRRVRDRLGDVSAKLQENLGGILVIKSFGREELEAGRFDAENRRYLEASMRAVLARALYFPGLLTVGFLSNLLMVGIGGYFVLDGRFTLGGLVAYRGYWWQLFSPVQSLARINEVIQRAMAAAARVFELLDEPLEIADRPAARVLDAVGGHIRFEAVRFAYAARPHTLLDIDFEARPGQRIGVVGPSGSGKSTLLALLLRLYDPAGGVIRLDGHDLRDVTQDSLRGHLAMVTQEPFLFNDTIRGNILYGRPEADDAQVREAARQANANDFILGLPQGYDTVAGERGVKLSGGQKQRICIARALLADPRVLLLDEATASVEPESESIIQAAIEHLLEGRTAIIVSHRLSMVRGADLILVLADGRIADRGTHEQLMGRQGWYERMYRLQMGADVPDRAV